jgi:hypothetical protein
VVYCGSSNLATGGEEANGDNLLEIHDPDVATAFAIEALLLVDHYAFLDRFASPAKSSSTKSAPTKSSPTKGSSAAHASSSAGKLGQAKPRAKKPQRRGAHKSKKTARS